jgi:hypothetical protein
MTSTFFLIYFVCCNLSNAQEMPKYFSAEFHIKKDSQTLLQSNVVTVAGSPGRLTALDATGAMHKFDFEIKPPYADAKGNAVMIIEARLYEGVNDEWVLRTEPQIGTHIGKKAMLSINGKVKGKPVTYELEATINVLTEQQIIEKMGVAPTKVAPCPESTPSELMTKMQAGAAASLVGGTGCCTVYCNGNPIQQCCGVLWCCNYCSGRHSCCIADAYK